MHIIFRYFKCPIIFVFSRTFFYYYFFCGTPAFYIQIQLHDTNYYGILVFLRAFSVLFAPSTSYMPFVLTIKKLRELSPQDMRYEGSTAKRTTVSVNCFVNVTSQVRSFLTLSVHKRIRSMYKHTCKYARVRQ